MSERRQIIDGRSVMRALAVVCRCGGDGSNGTRSCGRKQRGGRKWASVVGDIGGTGAYRHRGSVVW
jgi:hypothetical protein